MHPKEYPGSSLSGFLDPGSPTSPRLRRTSRMHSPGIESLIMILVISSKKAYATQRLEAEARSMKYELRVMETAELAAVDFKIDISPYTCLYVRDPYVKGSPEYLPKIVELAKKFKAAGKKVVDANIADGFLGDGKWADYQKLLKAGLPIPKTEILEATYYQLPTTNYILKWTYGFGGKNVFLINNKKQLTEILKKYPKKELLLQEYIKADYEYKVVTIGYKAVPVVLKFIIKDSGFKLEHDDYEVMQSPSLFKGRWIAKRDGRVGVLSGVSSNHPVPLNGTPLLEKEGVLHEVIRLAEKAAKLLGRELSKVDILQQGQNLYILEVNRFPGLESFEKLAKYNVTKEIVRYLLY